jgi:hypothetical protein
MIPNPWRDQTDQYVPLARQRLEKAKIVLIGLRSLAPTVYGDKGPFAVLGVQRHEAALKSAEIEVGLWEGRSASSE